MSLLTGVLPKCSPRAKADQPALPGD